MKIRHLLVATVLVLAVTLAVVVGQRIGTEAMAVLLGVIFGVAASMPTGLLISAIVRRAQDQGLQDHSRQQLPAQPPVIVVTSGAGGTAPWHQGLQWPAIVPSPAGEPGRRFRVVGEPDASQDGEAW